MPDCASRRTWAGRAGRRRVRVRVNGHPGLLQTEEYAEALTLGTGLRPPDHAERFVVLAADRARRLADDDPLTLHAVIGEAALRLRVNGDETGGRSSGTWRRCAELPNVTVQVLRPEDGRTPPDATGQVRPAGLRQRAPDRATPRSLDGAMYVQEPDGVRTYSMVADNLRQVALLTRRVARVDQGAAGADERPRRRPCRTSTSPPPSGSKSSRSTNNGDCVESSRCSLAAT